MQPHLKMSSLWHDDDMWEVELQVHDGYNRFTTKTYIGYNEKNDWITQLKKFATQLYGGLLDLQFGKFGSEYGTGAMLLRFHFLAHQKIHLSIQGQSDFFQFGKKQVAREAKLYFLVEPALLDRFIVDLHALDYTKREEAILWGIGK